MATTFEKLSSNKVKLGFVVHSEQFDEGIRKAYAKNAKKFNIPGFRRGKAPMKIIENFYGAGVFYEDAFDIIFPELYRAALAEHDVKPVDRPELEVEQIEKGKELKFTVEVFVRPDVELGEYRNLGIARTVDEVTDDDVMAEIERARDRAARLSRYRPPGVARRPGEHRLRGLRQREPFEGGAAANHDLTLGSGSFIPASRSKSSAWHRRGEGHLEVTSPMGTVRTARRKPALFQGEAEAPRREGDARARRRVCEGCFRDREYG